MSVTRFMTQKANMLTNDVADTIAVAPTKRASCVENLTGDTKLLTMDGELLSIEDLASVYATRVEVPCFDKFGRLTTVHASNFRQVDDWASETTRTTFASGLVVTTTTQAFLTPNNEWVPVSSLQFGDLVQAATYNSAFKHPAVTLDEVVHSNRIRLASPEPLYSFDVSPYGNVFVAAETEAGIALIAVGGAC